GFCPALYGDENLPAFGELYGVTHQVDNDLADAAGITEQRFRYIVLHLVDKLQALLMRSETEGFHGFTQTPAQVKGDRFQIEFAGFDLRKIQYIIDHC